MVPIDVTPRSTHKNLKLCHDYETLSFAKTTCEFSSLQWWGGAVIPIGLGSSLINNAIFLAAKGNEDTNVLTLSDVLANRYGKWVEVMVSLVAIASFVFCSPANLVGGACPPPLAFGWRPPSS